MTRTFAALGCIGAADAPGTRAGWRHFPAACRDVGRFAVAYAALVVVFVVIGVAIVHGLDHGLLGTFDRDVARWFADLRSKSVNDVAQIGAGLADAYTLTPAILIACVVFVAVFRRWNEAAFLLTAILLEKAVFVTTTFIVNRDRPPVGQLDGAPPTSSYPSGHVAAAVVFYVCIAIVVTWHARHVIVRVVAWSLAIVLPACVAISRIVLGMHYPTDVAIGATLGAASIVAGSYLALRTIRDLDARVLGSNRHLDGCAEVEQTTTEGDGAQAEPRRTEAESGQGVAEPVHAELNP